MTQGNTGARSGGMEEEKMAAKHTHGPWTARRMHTGGYDIFDPRGRDVVTVYGGGVETESRKANALLIASAPCLLASLEAIVAVYAMNNAEPHELRDALCHQIESAASAVQKARGAA